jgi:hypothetical protein
VRRLKAAKTKASKTKDLRRGRQLFLPAAIGAVVLVVLALRRILESRLRVPTFGDEQEHGVMPSLMCICTSKLALRSP